MSQDNKSSQSDNQNRQAEPSEAGDGEEGVGTKAAEARIWAAATKLGRDGKLQFPEIQE
jgi:hypothetical protein